MARALVVAARARRRSAPNPWVGCVLARDGEVVGEGATRPPGGAHAEVEALRAAGAAAARGCTAYVTLEPCSHHGRTPPCADALLDAGVARVVVATLDPDPHVAGTGIARLRDRGVSVEVGVGEDDARRLLAPYLVHRRFGRSFVLLKTASSLDGRITARDGSSQWITKPEARADAHELRADSQAVVIGAGTAIADHPSLTARDTREAVERQPLRVVLDAHGRVTPDGPLFDPGIAPTLVVTTASAPADAADAWLAAGAKVHVVPPGEHGAGVDLPATLAHLATLGVLQAMVEGGAQLAASLLDEGLVDRLVAYVAPTVLGVVGRPSIATAGPLRIGDATRFRLAGVTRLGDDVRLDYDTGDPEPPWPERGGG
jgi:diaminohydroxyphosphoribosylaminopyrimidine deaminase/5-amino-6-(5-phosphoribosylamino)uracil reductase